MLGGRSKKKGDEGRHVLLRIEAPGGRVWLVDLLGATYVLGRGDPTGATTVDFTVPEDEFLSRAHVRLLRDGDDYTIENLSPNGTLVDGVLIEQPQRLEGKEKIEVGQGTTATYLVVSSAERKRLFDEQSGIKERRAETGGTEEAAKKPFYLKPVFLAILGFYLVLGLVVFAMLGKEDRKAVDPGKGPYFTELLNGPVRTSRPDGDAAAQAERLWQEALARHGGSLLSEGGHAYELLLEARKVAGIMGYATLGQALEKGEPFAQRSQLVLDDLEKRVTALYEEADGYIQGRHYDLAYGAYSRLAEAVPDTTSDVRRFAIARMAKLKELR